MLGCAALGLLAASLLFAWTAGIPWALALVGAEFLLARIIDRPKSVWTTAIFAAGLLATAELAYWAITLHQPLLERDHLTRRRALVILGLALASFALAALMMAAGRLPLRAGTLTTLIAVAAGCSAFGLLAAFAVQTTRLRA